MRLKKLTLRGVTCFQDTTTIDFETEGLLALVGRNGAGKSSLLESVVLALYKSLPSRPGSIYEHCHGRDAFVEAVFEDKGSELKVRVLVDAERRTCESYVFEDGSPLTDGKSASFDATVRARFGSMDLFLSSVFSAQNKAGNFLERSKGERKTLFAELLQLGTLTGLAERAKVLRVDAEEQLEESRAAVENLTAETNALPGLEEELAATRERKESLAGEVSRAREEEHAALAAVERARGAREQLRALESAEETARVGLSAAERALTAARELEPAANRRYKEAMDRNSAAALRAVKLTEQGAEITAAVKQVAELEREAGLIEKAEQDLDIAERNKLIADHNFHAAENKILDLKGRIAKELDDAKLQAELLDMVPCTGPGKWTAIGRDTVVRHVDLESTCPLLANARKSRERVAELEGADIPAELSTALETAVAHQKKATEEFVMLNLNGEIRRARLQVIRTEELPKARALAGQASALEQAKASLEEIKQEAGRIAEQLVADIGDANDAVSEAYDPYADASERHIAALEALETGRRNLVDIDEPSSVARAKEAQRAREEAERNLSSLTGQEATLAERIRHLTNRKALLEEERISLRSAEQEVGDWRLLETGLGKDGIQALEIDAAGPEVARLTNDLLEATYGARFSLTFETLREKKSKPGEYSEAFDVRVFDAGAERQVEALSGGERVVVGEALGLALSIYNARKSGIRYQTIWRDETAGALDPENAQRYVQMLRRALALGNFETCVFIAHLPAVYESADVQIHVEGGRVYVPAAA